MNKLIVAIAICFLFYSCYYDKKELVYPSNPNTTCDTTGVTYTKNIAAIMVANCTSCHGTALAQRGIKLDTYASVKAEAQNSEFISSIVQDGSVRAMPEGSAKIADCSINQIKAWIKNGMPE